MSIKINSLEFENVKKIRAIKLEPSVNGLTVIGGNNAQGKTSVLDAICWALGGEKYRPSKAERDGSYSPPYLNITLSNGIVVERKGDNSTLKVSCPDGSKAGQTLLNSFIEELALDLPKFMQASNREKANILLKIIGIGDKLAELELSEKRLYEERYAVGRIADQKKKFAAELPHYDGVPNNTISAIDLIKRQQSILAKNGENAQKRKKAAELEEKRIRLEAQIKELSDKLSEVWSDLKIAKSSAENLIDESTAQLEKDIADIDNLNIRIRANLDKEKATMEADEFSEKYAALTDKIEQVRADRLKLLESADLPLKGLSVSDGELIYNGNKWDCLSGAEQLKVATAIVRKLNPDCGFVLLDGLEALDLNSLRDFGEWLETEGLQAIATRVSTGDECSIIIEEGAVAGQNKTWTEGVF